MRAGDTARRAGRCTGAPGLTLVESLISMGIMGIITAGMYAFFLATNQSYGDHVVVSRTIWTANDAMQRIAQDIRRAGASAPLVAGCVELLPTIVGASNASYGSITVRALLDVPASRTELAMDQAQTAATLRVLTASGWQVNDTAFLTDGTRCTRFTVTEVASGSPPGLRHTAANDANSSNGAAGYTYPAASSMVYRQGTTQEITYAIDTTDPATRWLTRNAGSGARRLVPDIESLSVSYLLANGSTVTDPTTVTAAGALDIRRVNITITAKADARSRQGDPEYRRRILTSSVKLRNLGL